MELTLPILRTALLDQTRPLVPELTIDVLVIGSGAAALRAALEAAEHASVLIVTKAQPTDSNSNMAQGGIATCSAPGDSAEGHVDDTLKSGCGLCDEAFVRTVVTEGAERVQELIDWGADFDRAAKGEIDFTTEGGHTHPRVLHAGGDATGAEVIRTLLDKVANHSQIKLLDKAFVIDLLTGPDGCAGAYVYLKPNRLIRVRSRSVVLAAGGLGRAFRETTNADVITGDGIAMAFRAGAKLRDMEFVQFHPTTLYVAGAHRWLISEAVRGEGAIIRDADGVPFMEDVHPMKDLAPRDVVARAIVMRMSSTRQNHVNLDLTHLGSEFVEKRFPSLWQLCQKFSIDPNQDLLPIRPSVHYAIGGVATDSEARTSLPNLYAAGEVACSGFHGANRLGSNSLLECLVTGQRAGRAAAEATELPRVELRQDWAQLTSNGLDFTDLRNSLQSELWRNSGVVRTDEGLREALGHLRYWSSYLLDKAYESVLTWELQNMFQVASLVINAALERKESRGAHYRSDYPDIDAAWEQHITIQGQPGI